MPLRANALPQPAGLAAPLLRGWPALQARLVNRIKSAALRHLHASAAGERLLLRLYLLGEECTEIALPSELLGEPPAWLARQMAHHLADERHHAALFAAALAAHGEPAPERLAPAGAPASAPASAPAGAPAQLDSLSRRKIAQWRALAQRNGTRFSAGLLVPAFAICLCTEQMASRVLQRHCKVIGTTHPLYPLLSGVLRDEDRHVRLCTQTLARLVTPAEQASLALLLEEIRAIDRAWGISGALALYGAGIASRLWPARA